MKDTKDKNKHPVGDVQSEKVFDFVSPAEMRKSIEKVFFSWLMNHEHVPQEVRSEVENIWFLIDFLEKEELKIRR